MLQRGCQACSDHRAGYDLGAGALGGRGAGFWREGEAENGCCGWSVGGGSQQGVRSREGSRYQGVISGRSSLSTALSAAMASGGSQDELGRELDRLMGLQFPGLSDGGSPPNPFLAGLTRTTRRGSRASRSPRSRGRPAAVSPRAPQGSPPRSMSITAPQGPRSSLPPQIPAPPSQAPLQIHEPMAPAVPAGTFVPDGMLVNLPGGLLLPGFGNSAQFQIGRGVDHFGTELLSFRLVLDGAEPDMLPPRPALQAMLNILAHQVMSQVAQVGRNAPRRTKESVIDSLPTCASASADDTKCAVCQESFAESGDADSTAVRLPCEHPFHRCCIVPWLQEHNTCPTCRFELDTDDSEYNARLHADRAERDRALEQKLTDCGTTSLSTAELKALLRLRKIERNSREDREGLIELLQGGAAAASTKRKRGNRSKPQASQPRDALTTGSTRSTRSTRSTARSSSEATVDTVDRSNDSDQENLPNPLETSALFEMDEPEGVNSGPTRRSSRSSRNYRLRGAMPADGENESDLVLRTSPRANAPQSSAVTEGAGVTTRAKRARRASTRARYPAI